MTDVIEGVIEGEDGTTGGESSEMIGFGTAASFIVTDDEEERIGARNKGILLFGSILTANLVKQLEISRVRSTAELN